MKKYISNLYKLGFLLLLSITWSCSEYEPAVSNSAEIPTLSTTQILAANGYTVLVDALELAGLTSAVNSTAGITVFAPNNIAFSNLLDQLGVASLSEVPEATLSALLSYHVSGTDIPSTELPENTVTLEGSSIYFVNGSLNSKSNIVETDLVSTNARVHGIDIVLEIPATSIFASISNNSDYELLSYAVQRAGLEGTLSGSTEFTLFAPNDASFAGAGLDSAGIDATSPEALADVLLFHVLAGRIYSTELPASGTYVTSAAGGEADGVQELLLGDGPSFNGTGVSRANVNTGNGVIHEVEDVLGDAFDYSSAAGIDNLVDGAFGTTGIGYENFFDLVNSTSYTDIYDVSQRFNVYVQLFGPSDVSQFTSEEAAIDYITGRMFPDGSEINGAANGTRITAVNGDEFFIAATSAGGEYLNGGSRARNAFGASSGTNWNSVFGSISWYKASTPLWLFSSGSFVPLPEANLTETVSAVDTLSLFTRTLELTGLDEVINTGDHTIFAVGDDTFSDATGYTTIADLDTLLAGGDEDLAVLDNLTGTLSLHIIPNEVLFSVVLTEDLPVITTLEGSTLATTLVETIDDPDSDDPEDVINIFGLIGDSRDISNTTYRIVGADGLTSNGVIHVLDGVIADIVQ